MRGGELTLGKKKEALEIKKVQMILGCLRGIMEAMGYTVWWDLGSRWVMTSIPNRDSCYPTSAIIQRMGTCGR